MATKFDPKKGYLMYGGSNRREVFVQDGELFNAKHERLEPDLDKLNKNRYAMNAELRVKVVEQRAQKHFQARLDKLQAEQEEYRRSLLRDHERQLRKQSEAMEEELLPPIPPHPSEPQVEPIQLTEIERQLLGEAYSDGEDFVKDDAVIPDEDVQLNLEDDDDVPQSRGTHTDTLHDTDPATAVKSEKTVTVQRKIPAKKGTAKRK